MIKETYIVENMIAIHKSSGFAERWITYCEQEFIDYKIVNCYDADII